MGTSQSTIDFLLDQMSLAGTITAKRMFGEYGLYLDGKFVAVACDDQLFVKPTAGGRRHIGTPTEAPPYPQAKPWFLVDGDGIENREWLAQLLRITAAELPIKPARPRKAAAQPHQNKQERQC